MTTLSVIVLAGGHSCRMGQDKALLRRNGESLLSRTVKTAQALSTDVLVVTPWPERYRGSLPTTVRLITESAGYLAPDSSSPGLSLSMGKHRDKPSAGPLHGFAQGWLAISSDWCLLLACDLPHLRADVLQQWWRRIQDCTVDGWLEPEMVPMASLAPGRRGWEPLCGFYHRRCLPSLNQRVETHQHSFQSWLKTFPIAGYNGVPSKMLFNCNTPADWKAANSQ